MRFKGVEPGNGISARWPLAPGRQTGGAFVTHVHSSPAWIAQPSCIGGLPQRRWKASEGSGARRAVRQLSRSHGQSTNVGLRRVVRARGYEGPARRPREGKDQTAHQVARRLSHAASACAAHRRRRLAGPRERHHLLSTQGPGRTCRRCAAAPCAGASDPYGRGACSRAATDRAQHGARGGWACRGPATQGQDEQQRPNVKVANESHGSGGRDTQLFTRAGGEHNPSDPDARCAACRCRSYPSARQQLQRHRLLRDGVITRNGRTAVSATGPRMSSCSKDVHL
jgi:hypothetical protein